MELENLILNNCKQYIEELQCCRRGSFLVRGFMSDIPEIKMFEHNYENRKPLNSPQHLHDLVNTYFEKKFNWKIRNGAFCYGVNVLENRDLHELGYGAQFLFFPIGEYSFVYNLNYFDLLQFFKYEMKNENEVENLNFRNDSLCLAIQNVENDNDIYSREISVKTSQYYLINVKHSNCLTKIIWG